MSRQHMCHHCDDTKADGFLTFFGVVETWMVREMKSYETWVFKELVPNLEGSEDHFRLCIGVCKKLSLVVAF